MSTFHTTMPYQQPLSNLQQATSNTQPMQIFQPTANAQLLNHLPMSNLQQASSLQPMNNNLQQLNYPYQCLQQPQLTTYLPAAAPFSMQHMPVIPSVALYSPPH
eukprot:1686627-Pleurochrysis_carterae.AAC.1